MTNEHDSLEADRQAIVSAHQRGTLAVFGVYARLSGPGWLQSAITLGGGSLASSLYLGVLAGMTMLWLQPLAMLLGIVMLSAIGYVAMSTGERPFSAINQHVNPVLGWGWALATLAANMVWCLPQFSLAGGVLQQNLLPGTLGPSGPLGDFWGKCVISAAILVITISITWAYDSGSWGIKLYELLLKLMVAAIVLCFVGVVVTLARADVDFSWTDVYAGFVPNWRSLFQPAPAFTPLLNRISVSSGDATSQFWAARIVGEQRNVMISAAATAVGINMTFLFPYTLLRRRWTREFSGLARFDLCTGMLIPFVIATSCVTIAAASQFHTQPKADLIAALTETSAESAEKPLPAAYTNLLDARLKDKLGAIEYEKLSNDEQAALRAELPQPEKHAAAALVARDAGDLAQALEPLTGSTVANLVFGLGVLGMTLSTITILMLISGFVVCEILDIPPEGWPHRLGTLAAATGALGPFVWSGRAQFFLAVPTSIFGMTLLPIAYFTFFLLMNQRSLLGDNMPRGGRRVAWNVLMAVAATIAGLASLWSIYSRPAPWNTYGLIGMGCFVGLAVVVQLARGRQRI